MPGMGHAVVSWAVHHARSRRVPRLPPRPPPAPWGRQRAAGRPRGCAAASTPALLYAPHHLPCSCVAVRPRHKGADGLHCYIGRVVQPPSAVCWAELPIKGAGARAQSACDCARRLLDALDFQGDKRPRGPRVEAGQAWGESCAAGRVGRGKVVRRGGDDETVAACVGQSTGRGMINGAGLDMLRRRAQAIRRARSI